MKLEKTPLKVYLKDPLKIQFFAGEILCEMIANKLEWNELPQGNGSSTDKVNMMCKWIWLG